MIGPVLQPKLSLCSHFCAFDVEMDLGKNKIGLLL